MRRCEYVEFYDGFNHDLEETTEKNHYKLNEITGEITFCESTPDGLVIRLTDHLEAERTKDKEIIWNFETNQPIPATCGQALRCFYEKVHQRGNILKIEVDAYELICPESLGIKNSGVVRRGARHVGYKFIE